MYTDIQRSIQHAFQFHSRNENIEFIDETHTYYYHGKRKPIPYKGITSIVKAVSPFDREGISKGVAYKEGKTQEQVLAEWDAKRDWGSEVHAKLHQWGETGAYTGDKHIDRLIKWLDHHELTPILFEHLVYDEAIGHATSIDLVCLNRHNNVVIVDFKTSKEIRKAPYMDGKKPRMMRYPLVHLKTANYFQYSLQVTIENKWIGELYLDEVRGDTGLDIQVSPIQYILHIRPEALTMHTAMWLMPEVNLLYENLHSGIIKP